jgi:DNA gyrase subunit B
MPAIIENGYLYIAQPPLYRAKRGGSEVYLKDDPAMEDYLFNAAIDEGTVFVPHDGEQTAGKDLRKLVEEARKVKALLATIAQNVPLAIVEQAAILGALNPEILSNSKLAGQTADVIAKRLDALEPPAERGWKGKTLDDGGLEFTRILRGVTEHHAIDSALIGSTGALKLNEKAGQLQKLYARHGVLTAKETEIPITGPVTLVDRIMELGRKGVSIQRYKGLGEMNPNQLWETTLDPEARSLLQVKVTHADDAEDVFSTLMGDVVEPRREFIQENALKVANLDV